MKREEMPNYFKQKKLEKKKKPKEDKSEKLQRKWLRKNKIKKV